jgi:hypothetical protein
MCNYLHISDNCRTFASEIRKQEFNNLDLAATAIRHKVMKTFSQYTNEVLTVVMNNLKNGVSGSTIADMMVSNYGFEREAALTIITGTILMLNKANLI